MSSTKPLQSTPMFIKPNISNGYMETWSGGKVIDRRAMTDQERKQYHCWATPKPAPVELPPIELPVLLARAPQEPKQEPASAEPISPVREEESMSETPEIIRQQRLRREQESKSKPSRTAGLLGASVRREKVRELTEKGLNAGQIAASLSLPRQQVYADQSTLRKEAQKQASGRPMKVPVQRKAKALPPPIARKEEARPTNVLGSLERAVEAVRSADDDELATLIGAFRMVADDLPTVGVVLHRLEALQTFKAAIEA